MHLRGVVPFWCILLVRVEFLDTFFVELSFRSIDGPPKTVELRSIQNENYCNLQDFHMIIAILYGALVSNTLCVFP